GTIGAMKEFAMIQSLNGGGPGTSNVLIVQYIYKTGFEQSKIGYASAASMVLMVILLAIALIQMLFDRSDLEWTSMDSGSVRSSWCCPCARFSCSTFFCF